MRKQSSKREDDILETTNRQLIDEEERERGSVGPDVYWAYATAVYKGALAAVIIVCQLSFTVSLVLTSLDSYIVYFSFEMTSLNSE